MTEIEARNKRDIYQQQIDELYIEKINLYNNKSQMNIEDFIDENKKLDMRISNLRSLIRDLEISLQRTKTPRR